MSTAADVKQAKRAFEDHCVAHSCRAGECETRKALWLAQMATAERLEA